MSALLLKDMVVSESPAATSVITIFPSTTEAVTVLPNTVSILVSSDPTVVPSEAEIRERAYYIYLENGSESGGEVENWLQAERELMKA